jgi:aminopeptidase N
MTQGDETVVVRLSASAGHIALNWRGGSLSGATIDGSSASIDVRTRIQQAWFSTDARLSPGVHTLRVHFQSAVLGSVPTAHGFIEQAGFYDASMDSRRPFLVTMFEPSTARRFFPCFDEPQFRAPITLHVTAPSQWTVVSNMPGTRTAQGAIATWDFAPTPPMPVYLLTLDAGRMSSVAGSADGIPMRIYAAEDYAAKNAAALQRSLREAERSLHFYQAYFGVRYPLPKLDIVVAPGVLHTALEQWGAITVYTPEVLDPETIAHEIAHQWFGDLVGMRWWSDVFVAEGLAQFAQYRADAAFEPRSAWSDEDSGPDEIMRRGISRNTVAIGNLPIATDLDDDDMAAFDTAEYDKSAAILRMWQLYAGDATFHRGVMRYLRENAGHAVTTDAFWRAFGDVRAVRFGDAWLLQPGFPIVDVRSSCASGRQTLTFTQTPFTNGKGAPRGYLRQRWPVPIVIARQNRQQTYLLDSTSMRLQTGACGESLTIDSGFRPYYRLRYEGQSFTTFARALTSKRARANAVRDALALYDAHAVSAAYVLDVLPMMPRDDAMLLRHAGETLDGLLAALPHGVQRDAVAAFVREIAEPVTLAQLRSPQPSEVSWPLSAALLAAGDGRVAPAALEALNKTQVQGHYTWTGMSWIYAGFAGQDADERTILRMEHEVHLAAGGAYALPMEYFYLANVTRPSQVREILEYFGGSPTMVFGLAHRNPQLVWNYLQQHARAVLSHEPPSQRGWTLASGMANTLWDTVPPAQMHAFLVRVLGPGYRADIDAAMALALRHRRDGAALAAQVAGWHPGSAGP